MCVWCVVCVYVDSLLLVTLNFCLVDVSPLSYVVIVICVFRSRRFEQWADECGVRHLRQVPPLPIILPPCVCSNLYFLCECPDVPLRQCFGETKELVRALLHPDLAAVADSPSLRRQLFPRIDPQVYSASPSSFFI